MRLPRAWSGVKQNREGDTTTSPTTTGLSGTAGDPHRTHRPVPAGQAGWLRDSDAVSAMQGRLEEVAGRINARAAVIEDDLITQGILLEISGGLAKHAWMMRVSRR